MRLPDILFLDIVVHVKECNYAIYVYIAEQAGALALECLEWMSVRHPRFDGWKQHARPSYMR